MEDDFTVVTTQDIIELRDAVREFRESGTAQGKSVGMSHSIKLMDKTQKLLDNMIKSTERHS